MDNFMEKITHRFSANDIIKANMQADAEELESAKEQLVLFENQMEKVDSAISDMRKINLKNIETAQDISNIAKDSADKMSRAFDDIQTESVSRIKETSDLSIAGINRTVEEGLSKISQIQSDDLDGSIKEGFEQLQAKLEEMKVQLEDNSHTDHVKIYRNVQASFVDELGKRSDEIKQQVRKKGAILPLLVITMLTSLASLVITILHVLGII